MLLDEPVSHLDINHQIEILELVDRLKKTKGLLVIMVIHDLNLAARYCDRLILLNGRTVQAAGTPAEVLTREHIRNAFKADVLVRRHPMTGSIYITLMNTVKPDRQSNERSQGPPGLGRRHRGPAPVCAGIAGLHADGRRAERPRLRLRRRGRAGCQNDHAKRLSRPSRRKPAALNLEAMKAADVIVVSDVPFGWGNLKNLESVAELAGSKPIVLVEGRGEPGLHRRQGDGDSWTG